jgi:hypothetical protein
MAIQIQLRKGTATEHNTFTGADGEVTVDTTNKTLVVHDGVTTGGTPLLKASQLVDSTTTVKGIIELATQSEVNTGTDTDRAVTPATLKSTFPIQAKTALSANGLAPIYACRANACFSGVSTVTILSSQNIASITRTATGTYVVTFTNPMPHNNYTILTGVGDGSRVLSYDSAKTENGFTCTYHSTGAGSLTDGSNISFGVFC